MGEGRLDRLRGIVMALCSEECQGREAGSKGGAAACALLEAELGRIGLEPAGEQGYRQPVPLAVGRPGRGGANLLARIPGNGPLAERVVLVGAHYDHLGRNGGDVFHGADDNAAAVAMVLELGRELLAKKRELGRSIVIALFDAEEPPHFTGETMGSMRFCARPTIPLDRIDLMVCLDLVGHACGGPHLPAPVRGSLFVLGAETSEGTGELVDRVAKRAIDGGTGVWPRRLHGDVIPPLSDYYAFGRARVPWVFLSCGRWEHYHQPSDLPERLDWEKIAASCAFLIDLAREASLRPEPRVEYLPNGRDDHTTIRSLLEVGKLLLPTHPQLAMVLPRIEPLLGRPRLSVDERQQLSMLVGGLEALLRE